MQIEMWPVERGQPLEPGTDAGHSAAGSRGREQEAWAPIPGYEGLYDVSSYGRVRRSSKSRMAPIGYLLKPRVTHDGYLRYGLSKHRRYWHVKAHRLVALAFLGSPPCPGSHVAHFDGDKLNNHVSNLRWATQKENEADKRRHGRVGGAPPGERHPMAKLTVATVRGMRRLAAAGTTVKSIAAQFGVPKLTAYDAIVGNTWKLVSEPHPVSLQRRRAS
jgi:hypothetical protein